MSPINQVVFFKNFRSLEAYQKEVKRLTVDALKSRVKLLGLTAEDLESYEAVEKYNIGRDDKQEEGKYLLQTCRVMGIMLLETLWEPDKATICSPVCVPDYTSALEYIQSMPIKNKK